MKKILFIIIALLLSYCGFSQCTITSLPYSEDFTSYGQGYTAFPTCWYNSCTGNNSLYIYNNKLIFHFYNCTAITPAFDSSINIKNLSINFGLKHSIDGFYANTGKMYVGVMDNPTDLNSFDPIAVFSLPVDVQNNVTVNFNHYQGEGHHIAFKASHQVLTDLNIDFTPLCAPPYNLRSNINANIAKLSWLPGNDFDTAWWVYYKANSSTSYDSVLVNSPIYNLNNLLPNSDYKAYVRTSCGSYSSTNSDTISFRTYCNTITTLPYIENFNTYSSGAFPTCWYNYNSDGITNTVYTAAGALYFSYSTNLTRMAITPYFDENISLNISMLKFRYMANEYDNDTVYRPLVIGAISDINDLTAFDSITTIYANSNWKNIDLNLSKYDFIGNYIVFKHSNGSFEVGIKNVIIDSIPTCPRPINPTVDSVSLYSANISWDLFSGDESLWKIYYKPDYSQTYDSVITSTNLNNKINILPSSNYQAFIVTLCGTSQSQHSDTLYFRTDCSTIDTLPFIETFTRTGVNAYPNCWVTYKVDKLYNGTIYMGNNGYFVTPEIDSTINISDLIIRFKSSFYNASLYNEDNPLAIGVMANPNDTNTFDTIAMLKLSNNLSEYDISFENYTGNGRYIAFKKNYYTSYITFDDLIIDDRSNYCIRPDSLVAIKDTSNVFNINISWVGRDPSDIGYWVYSKLNNSNFIDSFYTTDNYIILYNLIPNASYSFYIKTFCSVENKYLTTASILYYTPCTSAPINVFPYFEDFNSGINCWILKNNGELKKSKWSSLNGYAYYNSNSYASYNNLYDPFLISPAFNFTDNMELSFNLYKYDEVRRLRAYLNSTPDTIGGILLGEVTTQRIGNNSYWDTIKFLFPINSFGLKYLVFEGLNNGEINIDNIQIKASPTCPENYNLKVNNINETSINLSWENSIIVPQNWALSYQAIDSQFFNPDSPLATQILIPDNDLTQTTISGLISGTVYSFALRPLCDSNWSDILSIRTLKNAQLPYFTNFNDSIDNYSWYLSKGGALNVWCISSAVDNGIITGKSLLISNNNGVTNAYSHYQTSCVTASRKFESTGAHAYTLNFDLRMKGKNAYDYLKVFVVDEDTNYIGGNTKMYYAYSTFSNHAVLFGGHNNTCPSCPFYTKGDTITTTHYIQLGNQGPAGNVRKLIFLWFNDYGSANNPPPAIDNISITNYVKEIHIYDTICKGDTINFYGQNLYIEGNYTQQFQTANVLDSIIYLDLIVNTSYNDIIFAEICQGEIYNQFGFNDSITGFYTQNLQTVLGCDSIVNLNLNVHSVLTPSNLILDNISNYIELTWNGDEENYIIYKDSDSLAITNLKVYRDTNVVAGENYCYKIKALTGDCYSDYSSEECMIFSSIGDVNTYNLNVTLYPNPTENKTILRFDGEKENADIHIYDINGKLVKTLKLKAEDDELEINVQGFEKGVYNIRITNSKINIIKKLIII